MVFWPVAKYCSDCLGQTQLRKMDKKGKIIEISKINENYFGLIEFEKGRIRLMATINKEGKIGQKVYLEKFHIFNSDYEFEVNLA